MVSNTLYDRQLFSHFVDDETYDMKSQAFIDTQVRRLVLTMRAIEVSGRMPMDKIERCVVRAFEKAEHTYYGMDEMAIKDIVARESSNDKGRARNK